MLEKTSPARLGRLNLRLAAQAWSEKKQGNSTNAQRRPWLLLVTELKSDMTQRGLPRDEEKADDHYGLVRH